MNNVSFADEIAKYYKHFKIEQELTNKAKNTIISYNTTISSFIEFLGYHDREINFDTIKKIDILSFIEYKNINLEKQGELKPSSKDLYKTHLKTFFTFISENFEIDIKINTIFKFKIKVPKRVPKGVKNTDVEKFEAYLKTIKLDSFLNVRASLLLKVLYYSGARRGELEAIKVSDFIESEDLYIINTIGKGDKERILYVPKDEIKNEITYFINNEIEYIAQTSTGNVMDGSQIYRFLNNTYKKIGINYTGVHILRHTYAKIKIENGVNIIDLAELMGHADIQTTTIYTQPDADKVRRAYSNSLKKE